jgi:hypothetical protein
VQISSLTDLLKPTIVTVVSQNQNTSQKHKISKKIQIQTTMKFILAVLCTFLVVSAYADVVEENVSVYVGKPHTAVD